MTTGALAVLALALAPGSPPTQDLELDEVLLFARAAQGLATRPEVSRVTGEATLQGTDARFELVFDDDALFRLDVKGRVSRRCGNDPAGAWEVVHGVGPYDLELTLREETLLFGWTWTGQWSFPETPLDLELLRADDAEVVLAAHVRGGLVGAELVLDAGTFLPSRLLVSGHERPITFDDYRSAGGIPLAWSVDAPLGPGLDLDLRVKAVAEAALTPAALARPSAADDTRFDRSAAPAIELHTTPSGHLLVRARVAGEAPGWFLFDTGAGFSGLNPVAAHRLGLPRFGKTALVGVGGSAGEKGLFVAPLELGPLRVQEVVFVENDKGRRLGPVDGDPVVGVLGWDVLARCVAVLDVGAGKLELHDPARFELEEGEWQPLSIHHRVPYVPARYEGEREDRFMLDTGAGNLGALFFAHATTELGLLDGRKTEGGEGQGAGGAVPLAMGELEWIEVLGRRFESVTTAFSTEEDGEADPYSVGLLGNGVLREVRIVLDFARRRMAIVP